MPDGDDNPFEPVEKAPDEVQRLIMQLLQLERTHLYEERPRLKEEIAKIVRNSVQ